MGPLRGSHILCKGDLLCAENRTIYRLGGGFESIGTQRAMCGESEGPSDRAGRQAMTHEVSRHQCGERLSTFSEKTLSVRNSQPTCPSHPQGLCRKIPASASHDLFQQEGGGRAGVREGREREGEMERNGLLFCHSP